MGKFEDTITKFRELLGETGKAAEEVVNVQKLKLQISGVKAEINKLYAALGEHTYKNTVEAVDNAETAAELVSKITEKFDELEKIELQLAKHKGSQVCECGAINKSGSKYCNTCGKELGL